MHAFLIVGNNPEKEIASRIAEWKISVWDIVRASGTGISDIRDFRRELSMTPLGKKRVGIIEHIELLTTEAQNALLKTLEEPPPATYIIGTTNNPEALLPTILSRMHVVRLSDTAETNNTALLSILDLPIGKRLTALEQYTATRDSAKKYISDLMGAAHQELLTHPSKKLTTLIRNLLAAQSQLSVNVNQKLVVDNIFLTL